MEARRQAQRISLENEAIHFEKYHRGLDGEVFQERPIKKFYLAYSF